jgi:glycosyltransferase involved in cell wall biosynthesis
MLRDGENVLLVEPNHPDAVVDAIRRLAGDEGLRRRMSAAGRATACQEAGIERFAADVGRVCDIAVRQG